jgi:hypothetical protein
VPLEDLDEYRIIGVRRQPPRPDLASATIVDHGAAHALGCVLVLVCMIADPSRSHARQARGGWV